MLDVHPPHKAIHGTGEFFLHLFTITVGLLIAVGIEGAVTRHEHTKLADEARETMTAEIRHNSTNVADALRDIEAHQKRISENLTALAKIQKNPKDPAAKDTSIDASYGSTGLERTAWRTAQATGALNYMPYEEAQSFSGIYEAADVFEKSQDLITEDEAQLLGIIRRYPNIDNAFSKEAADAMAERFGIWQGHLLVLHISAAVLQDQQKAFLEHRKPTKHMFEKINN